MIIIFGGKRKDINTKLCIYILALKYFLIFSTKFGTAGGKHWDCSQSAGSCHPWLLFLAQNLGVLQPFKTRYNFLWDTLYIFYIYGRMFTLNWIAQLYCLWPCVSIYWSMEMNFQIGSELLQRIFAYHLYLISWHSLSCDITIPITTWRYQWVGLQQ